MTWIDSWQGRNGRTDESEACINRSKPVSPFKESDFVFKSLQTKPLRCVSHPVNWWRRNYSECKFYCRVYLSTPEHMKRDEAGLRKRSCTVSSGSETLLDLQVAATWHEHYVTEGPRAPTCVFSQKLGFLPPTLIPNLMGYIRF